METLKKLFPLSFKRTDTAGNLIVGILLYIIVGVIAGAVITLATMLSGWIPVLGAILGWALGVIGSLIGVYTLAGIVIQILVFANVLKD